MKTVLLNKSGSLGQEIHLFQAPRKHLGLIKRESQNVSISASDAPQVSNTGSHRRTSRPRDTLTSTRQAATPKHFIILAILSDSRRGERCYRSKTGKKGRKAFNTFNIPTSKLVIILPVNGTVHHKVHLQGVKEPGAGSSR